MQLWNVEYMKEKNQHTEETKGRSKKKIIRIKDSFTQNKQQYPKTWSNTTTMANPRKFSEKIALHNQKQAEETAAFEKIMREVSDATSKVIIKKKKKIYEKEKNNSELFLSW